MLSVRNRVELGFVSREKGMEENELEEGEALSCYADEFADPDVALSYIDEKIQDVLGHFQKDFEGLVSVENLGAKYGAYGSFLPTYQRSPAISFHHKSPLKPPTPTASKSPCNLSAERARQNPPVSSTPVTKNNLPSFAQNRCAPTVDSNKLKSVTNASDQKSLKVRIKVGPDSTLARNTAAIYSGLGLDASPSSSPEDSTEACRSSLKVRDAPGDSPSFILQAMTSFSVPGGYLLSPLNTNLSQFTIKESFPNRKADNLVEPSSNNLPMKELKDYSDNKKSLNSKNSTAIEEDCVHDTSRRLKDYLDKKRSINSKNDDRATEHDCVPDTSKRLKKERVIDVATGKKAVSDSLNMPVESCSINADSNCEKQVISGTLRGSLKALKADDISKKAVTDRTAVLGSAKIANEGVSINNNATSASSKPESRTSLSKKETETMNSHKLKITSSTSQEGDNKKHKINNISESNSGHKGFYDRNVIAESSKSISAHKGVSLDRQPEKKLQKTDKKQEGEKRQNGDIKDAQTSEPVQTKKNSEISSGKRKRSHSKGDSSEDKFNKLVTHKASKKCHSKDSSIHIDSQGLENAETWFEQKRGMNKDVNMHPQPTVSKSSAFTSNSDAAVALDAPPAVVNWVCCDKCELWRLLPHGQDPKNLPKKWLCSMQDWLPGLNKCYISEDETTKAFNELFQVPAPYSGDKLNVDNEIDPPNNSHQCGQFPDDKMTFSIKAKTKFGLKDTLNAQKSSQLKKSSLSSAKAKLDASDYPRETNMSFEAAPSKSEDNNSEKHFHRHNDRHQIQGRYSDGGEVARKSSNNVKAKIKREVSEDGFRPPKKIKKETSNTDHIDKIASGVDRNLSAKVNGKIMLKNNDLPFSKDSKGEIRDKSSTFIKKSKDVYLNGNNENISNSEDFDTKVYAAKKRKLKEWRESQVQKDTVMSPNEQMLYAKEYSNEGGPKKQKRAKLSNYEGCGITNNLNEKVDQKVLANKNLLPTAATTSSSSKVSSSRKSKVDHLREIRGSPIESVSSSPLRTSVKGKFIIRPCKSKAHRNDTTKADSSLVGPHDKCLNGELGNDQSESQMKKKTGNSGFQLQTMEASQDESFSKRGTKSHLLPAEFKEKKNAVDVEKDNNVSEDQLKLNNHRHSNGSSNNWKSDIGGNRGIEVKADLGCKDEEINAIKNKSCNHNGNSNLHEALRDDKKSDIQKTDQPILNGIDDGLEMVLGNKRVPSKPIRLSKGKGEDQSSSYQAVVHAPTNTDANDHTLTFPKHPDTPDVHLSNNNLKQDNTNSREHSQMTGSNAVLKGARSLKHTANRMKKEGKYQESIGIYFEAALQYLHGSFLMEPVTENDNMHMESDQTKQMMNYYSDTARLFEYCAHEYEKIKEMAGVALAYKCVEVAYMKVAYYKNASASKDRLELQTVIQNVLPGESPSSSASDVDNLNNHGALDKVVSVKIGCSPRIPVNHIITARHRTNFVRLLEYTQYMNYAFDATKKSQNAIAAASVGMERDEADRLTSVRQSLDFNFQNVEGFLRLIRVSKESINL